MGGGLGSRLGSLSNRPIRITFEGGKVKAVECRDATLESYVKKFLGDGMGHDRVGLIRLGANIGVAAPMAYFPFSGWKDSFFGIMHAQGRDAIEFYTEKKIVVERWAKEHSRKF